MQRILLLIRILLVSSLLAGSCLGAAASDDAFLAAQEAYESGNISALDVQLEQLQDHELLPYVRYWRLSLEIENIQPEKVHEFLNSVDGTLVADRMRARWLRQLA